MAWDACGHPAINLSDRQTSNLFYQVISTRYAEGRSTLITTNTIFSEWGNILHDSVLATAVADRLVENSESFVRGVKSLRQAKKIRSRPEPEPAPRWPVQKKRRSVMIARDPEKSGGSTPQRRCGRGEAVAFAPSLSSPSWLCLTSAPITYR